MWIYAGFLRLNFYLPFTDVPPAYSLRWESDIRAVWDTAIKVRCSHSIIPFDLYNLSPLRLSYVASHCFFFSTQQSAHVYSLKEIRHFAHHGV